jgi:tetratricopeptide (TPR) repeat protein
LNEHQRTKLEKTKINAQNFFFFFFQPKTQGNHTDALAKFEEALSVHRSQQDEFPDYFVELLRGAAGIRGLQGEISTSLMHCDETLAILQKNFPPNHPKIADVLSDRADVFRDLGDLRRALAEHEDVLATRRTVLPAGHRDIAHSLGRKAHLLRTTGNFDGVDGAMDKYGEALPMLKAAVPADEIKRYDVRLHFRAARQPATARPDEDQRSGALHDTCSWNRSRQTSSRSAWTGSLRKHLPLVGGKGRRGGNRAGRAAGSGVRWHQHLVFQEGHPRVVRPARGALAV